LLCVSFQLSMLPILGFSALSGRSTLTFSSFRFRCATAPCRCYPSEILECVKLDVLDVLVPKFTELEARDTADTRDTDTIREILIPYARYWYHTRDTNTMLEILIRYARYWYDTSINDESLPAVGRQIAAWHTNDVPALEGQAPRKP
jgi:hypothetical protein